MKIVLFDFDGVMVDTFSFCHAISNLIHPISEDDYRKRFEGNIFDSVKKPKEGAKKIDFWGEYKPELMKCVPVKGISELIKDFSEIYVLIIISSTISHAISDFLDENNLRKYFKEILGADIDKSKINKICGVLNKYPISSSDIIFITDSLGDIKEARECGVKSIAVTWGYHPKETLIKGEPYKIVDQPLDIKEAVDIYFSL